METVIDPVCGRAITPETAVASAIGNEREYWFCSRECFELFLESPGDYIDTEPVDPAFPDEGPDEWDERRTERYIDPVEEEREAGILPPEPDEEDANAR